MPSRVIRPAGLFYCLFLVTPLPPCFPGLFVTVDQTTHVNTPNRKQILLRCLFDVSFGFIIFNSFLVIYYKE